MANTEALQGGAITHRPEQTSVAPILPFDNATRARKAGDVRRQLNGLRSKSYDLLLDGVSTGLAWLKSGNRIKYLQRFIEGEEQKGKRVDSELEKILIDDQTDRQIEGKTYSRKNWARTYLVQEDIGPIKIDLGMEVHNAKVERDNKEKLRNDLERAGYFPDQIELGLKIADFLVKRANTIQGDNRKRKEGVKRQRQEILKLKKIVNQEDGNGENVTLLKTS